MNSIWHSVLTTTIAVGLWTASTATLKAQAGQGFTVQETPGIAMVKPQPWSKDNEATLLEFLAFTDRSTAGGETGYYEFRTKGNPKRQVAVAKVVTLYVYPRVGQITQIETPAERAEIGKQVDRVKTIIAKFPSSRTYLEPHLKMLSNELAQFDSGKVKIKGQWLAADQVAKQEEAKLISLLKSDIERTRPVSNIDLANDPKYIALVETGKTNPEIKRQVEQIDALYAKALRVETRAELARRISAPDMTVETAKGLMAELKGMNPQEDPASAAFVKKWETNMAISASLTEQMTAAVAAFEAAMQTSDGKTPPNVSPELTKQLRQISKDFQAYMATNPPEQMFPSQPLAAALVQCSTGLQEVRVSFAENKFFDAKTKLEKLTEPAKVLGPNTVAAFAALDKTAAEQTDKFTRIKDEADALAQSGQKSEALMKYEIADKIVSNDEVKRQIMSLRSETPLASPTR